VAIGVVRAACKAGRKHVHFGGAQQSIALLLGEEEMRTAAFGAYDKRMRR
jgi:hypothetical protein